MLPTHRSFIPNALATASTGILNLLFPIEIAGKIYLTIYVLIFSLGSYYLLNSLAPKKNSALVYIPFLFILSFTFFHGYISYILSLGILFLGNGYALRRREEIGRINFLVLFSLSILLFFAHATSYAMWVIFLSIFAMANWSKLSKSKFILSVLPSLILLFMFLVNKFGGGYKYRWVDIEVIGLFTYMYLDNPLVDFKLKEFYNSKLPNTQCVYNDI